jgi:hypothetical protein
MQIPTGRYSMAMSCLSRLRKDRRDSTIELIAADQSGVHASHDAGRVDEDRRRLALDSICAACTPTLVESNGEWNGKEIDELLDFLCISFLISTIDGEDVQTRFRVHLVSSNKLREFGATGRTPRSPERDDDRMPVEVGQLDAPSRQSRKVDFRRTPADSDGLCVDTRRRNEKSETAGETASGRSHYNLCV